MKYLFSVLDDEFTTAGGSSASSATAAFNERLQANGNWVFAGGLGSPATATVVDNRDGQPVLTDGPYLESKEYLGGLWIVEAPDLDAALKLAAEGSNACNRRVEVRPFDRT